MSHLLWSLLFTALYGFLGLGVTLLVLPAQLRRYTLLVAPLIGFSVAILAARYFAVMGFRGTDAYASWLWLLGLIPLVIAIYVNGRHTTDRWVNADAAIAGPLGLLAFLFAAFPSMIGRTGLTAITLGNADIALYSVMARYLKEFPLGETTGLFTQEPWMIVETATDRFGAVIATALPAALFSLGTYQLQNVAAHVFFALTVAMVFVAGREVFGFGRITAALGALLVAVNPLLYYTLFHDFIAQIIGMAMALLLVVIHAHVIRDDSFDSYRRGLAIAALTTWGLSTTYGHMIPVFFAAMGVWATGSALHRRSVRSLLRWVAFCATVGVVVVLASPGMARVALGQVVFLGGTVGGLARAPRGWFVPWLFPSGLFTLPSAFPWASVDIPALVNWTVAIAFFVLLALGLVEAYRRDRSRLLTMLAWLLPIVAGTIALAYLDRTPMGWCGYASYKFLSFFVPILALCLVSPFADRVASRLLRQIAAASLAIIVVVSVHYSWRLLGIMRAAQSPTPDMAALQKVEAMSAIDAVNIPDSQAFVQTMWKANFLARKTLHIQERIYYERTPPTADWTLVTRTPVPLGPVIAINVDDGQREKAVPINDTYALERVHGRLRLDFTNGWYPAEPTLKWTGLNGAADAFLIVNVLDKPLHASVTLEYFPLNPQNQLSLYLDNRHIADCATATHRCAVTTELPAGSRVLRLHTSLAPSRPDNGDPRVLGFAITKIQIDEITRDTAATPPDAR